MRVCVCSGGDRGELQKSLLDIVVAMQRHSEAWPFLKPVSKEEAEDYYDVITEPIGAC